MKNRLGLTFLGDRHTPVGRGVGVCRQRRRSSADDRQPRRRPTESTSPTATASTTSPTDAATAEATAAMTELLRRPRRAPAAIHASRPQEAEDRRDERTAQRRADTRQVDSAIRASARSARPRISELKVQSVNLDNSDPEAGKVPTVVIDVCWDVSKVDVLDKSGKSIVSPDRPDTGWTRYTVANYDYAADPTGGWRVATGQDLKKTPCAAS